MNAKQIMQIFRDTAYVRVSGSDEETKTAAYLTEVLAKMGLTAQIEPFDVPMARDVSATLLADGGEIPCEGYRLAGSGEVEAPLYYLTSVDPYSLSQCRGKIVLIEGYLGYWKYHDLVENGAVGFITFDGDANYRDSDMDKRELRKFVVEGANGVKLPGVNINAKSAIAMIKNKVRTVKLTLSQEEYEGQSHNVILDLPGEIPETILFTAHYDSTPLSTGAYDNMSGSIGLLWMAEYFAHHAHRHSLRFVWCGSEERGLLGSKAYVTAHEELLDKIVLNINLDMIGCIMGGFAACCTSEDKLVSVILPWKRALGSSRIRTCTPAIPRRLRTKGSRRYRSHAGHRTTRRRSTTVTTPWRSCSVPGWWRTARSLRNSPTGWQTPQSAP